MQDNSSKKTNFFARKEYQILLLVIVGVSTYANSLNASFVFDDKSSILENPHIRHLWPLSEVISAPPQSGLAGRPLISLTLALNYAISGISVWSYHLFNLIVHILAALTLYGIVKRTLLCGRLVDRFGKRAGHLAWVIAAIWLLHPIQTESVTYIIQRAESLMGLFYLLTLYSLIRAITSRQPAFWFIVSILFCALGMATKEVMVTAPLLLLLYDRAFAAGSFGSALRRRWAFYIGLVATWGILAVLMLSAPRSDTVGFSANVPAVDYALNQFRVVVHYLRLCLWPAGLCLDYRWPLTKNWADFVMPMLIIVPVLIVTLWALFQNRSWSYPLVWLFGILAPTSSFVPLADLAFEHRLYLSLAGFVTLSVTAGYLLLVYVQSRVRLPVQAFGRRLVAVLVVVLVAALASATVSRNRDYRSPESIWRTVVDVAPNNPRAHSNLGVVLKSQGRFTEATDHYRQALKLIPDYPEAHNNLANVLQVRGMFNEAIHHYRQALKLKPDFVEAHTNLALALKITGQLDQAVNHFREAVKLKNNNVVALNNLAWILVTHPNRDKRDANQAVLLAQRAAKLTKYQDSFVLKTLATAYAEAGRFDLAVKVAQTALPLALAAQDSMVVDYLRQQLQIYRQNQVEPDTAK